MLIVLQGQSGDVLPPIVDWRLLGFIVFSLSYFATLSPFLTMPIVQQSFPFLVQLIGMGFSKVSLKWLLVLFDTLLESSYTG